MDNIAYKIPDQSDIINIMKKKITEFIHKETNRSVLQETSLPLYLTSGYVYNSAQEAEDVFNEKKNYWIYTQRN